MSIADNLTKEIADRLVKVAEHTPEVYDAGHAKGYSQAESDFWDAYQYEGRTQYDYAFAGPGWSDATFNPKRDIVPARSERLFQESRIVNLVEILERNGVTLDLSKASGYYQFYNSNRLLRLPRIDLATTKYYNQTFASCVVLVTIDCVVTTEAHRWYNAFQGCKALENLTIEGTIGQNGFNVAACTKLSHASLMSIINALKDYSADTSGTSWVVILGPENLAKLTDAEIAIATEKGWTIG